MPSCTLTAALETVGTPTLWPWLIPTERAEQPISDVVIHDREQPESVEPGAIVLAVGLDVPASEALLASAAAADAAAVVVRGTAAAKEPLREAAKHHRVALLAVAPGVSWTQISSLLRNAMSTTGVHAAGETAALAHSDLTAVANSIASAVHGSVVIFSPQQEILAASKIGPDDDAMRHRAIADQHGPLAYRERLRELGVYKQLWRSDEVVSVPAVPELDAGRRKAIMVRAGEEILGSIWVAEGREQLAPDADEILRSAAAAASGHLVWLQARALSQRRLNEGVLLQLLAGDADVETAASWLGVPADRACGVMIAWTPEPVNLRRLNNLLTMHLTAYQYAAVSLVSRSTVELVCYDLGEAGIPLNAARDLVSRAAQSLGQQVLAAVGTRSETLAELPRSHRDADAVLRVLRRRTPVGCTKVASYADVRTPVQLDRLNHLMARHDDLTDGYARILVDWDERHGTNLAASLLAYLDAFGNFADGAERIHVHPNTLRYRVRKACEVSGLDLTDPEQRLVTHLQLAATPR